MWGGKKDPEEVYLAAKIVRALRAAGREEMARKLVETYLGKGVVEVKSVKELEDMMSENPLALLRAFALGEVWMKREVYKKPWWKFWERGKGEKVGEESVRVSLEELQVEGALARLKNLFSVKNP